MFSSITNAAAFLSLVALASAHCAVLEVASSLGDVTGAGWGVNTHGKFPHYCDANNVGSAGDPGADSTQFGTSDSPDPPCGRTNELGALDATAQMRADEERGIITAYNNGSIVMKVFQVDADGAGPMSCECNEDGSLNSWKPMTINLNMAGNFGVLQDSNCVNSTVVATFANNTSCSGGSKGDTCVIRCRAGSKKTYGSCLTAKLATKTFVSTVKLVASVNPPRNDKRDMDVEERDWDDEADSDLETRDLFERAKSSLSSADISTLYKLVGQSLKKLKLTFKQGFSKDDFIEYVSQRDDEL